MPNDLPHILVTGVSEARDFKSTLSVQRQPAPQQARRTHGARLLRELGMIAAQAEELRLRRFANGLDPDSGVAITIEVSPLGALDPSQMEWRRDGIEVLNVIQRANSEIVTLFVPDGRLSAFERRIRDYMERDVQPRKPDGRPKPANANLVNAIHSFRRAAFEQLWTDPATLEPPSGEHWFQLWLRTGARSGADSYAAFVDAASQFELPVATGYVSFPGRIVVAVRATRQLLETALDLLDVAAEIRLVHPTATFFTEALKPFEQAEWIQDLAGRIQAPTSGSDAAHVCVMDTGVNNAHPLLDPFLEITDCHSVDAAWPVNDDDGHGTEMAGLSSIGDLAGPLSSNAPIDVPHRLESVRIWPPHGRNPPRLYGAVTAGAIGKVEGANPFRRRVFAMMTTETGDTSGVPTEWSAAVDRIAFGLPLHEECPEVLGPKRLIVLAAGNIPWPKWGQPNELHPIESPGQSWNTLTVGACTDLIGLHAPTYPSYQLIRQAGEQAACSRTSVLWTGKGQWPIKPDVVAEGGNGCFDIAFAGGANSVVVGPDGLRLLAPGHEHLTHPLTVSGDTSAATAEVARVCAHLSSRYPGYWPETIRGLVVHGAWITPAMRANLSVNPTRSEKERLLRSVGYGKVSLDRSLNSTSKRVSLILQEEITPYEKDGSSIKLGEMHLHDLPWPADALQAIAGANVALRVTLSYFVEPNPSRRGWQSKFRYQSHGLRFAIKGATETEAQFLQRINKLEREAMADNDGTDTWSDPDSKGWAWGAQLRGRGSIHHDEWHGNAASLAAKSHIAVYPVGGWWKDWRDSDKHSTPVRYSLVATLDVLDDIDVDIYTPVAVQVGVPIVV